jgi:F-type H+-transporting ATPase subunit epsilon
MYQSVHSGAVLKTLCTPLGSAQFDKKEMDMQLQLITPEKILFEGQASYVSVPGTMGEFGVLPGHAPFVSTLKEGAVTVDLAGGEKKEFAITGGIAEVVPEKCVLLVDVAT